LEPGPKNKKKSPWGAQYWGTWKKRKKIKSSVNLSLEKKSGVAPF